jgi:RimJ/RimL family protein N-acetyltransferase
MNSRSAGGWPPSSRGRGLAREGAEAIRDEAFTRLSADSVVARIQPANAASLRLARSIGLVPDGTSRGRTGRPIRILRLTAKDWRRAASRAT